MTSHTASSAESDGQFDIASMPDGALHQLMINEWLCCFQRNADFKSYCDAKRTGDDGTCRSLETKHARITELYADWGDIHALPSMRDPKAFSDWFDSKEHLFPFHEAKLLDLDDLLVQLDSNESHLVAIPKGLRKEQLIAVLTDFAEKNPELHGNGSKYEYSRTNGEALIDTWRRLRRAETAYIAMKVIGPAVRPETKSFSGAAVKAVLHVESANRALGFDWFIHGDINQKLFQQDKLPADVTKNYTSTMNNLNKTYLACIEGTIRGVFPSKM